MAFFTSTRRRLLGAVALGLAAGGVARAADKPKYKALFQVSDGDKSKWNLTLNNIRNAQEALGADNVSIELVTYGPGIDMLRADSSVAARVTEALHAGVRVAACQNSMRGSHLTPQDMVPDIGFVPAGVAEIIQRQAEGYAYLRS